MQKIIYFFIFPQLGFALGVLTFPQLGFALGVLTFLAKDKGAFGEGSPESEVPRGPLARISGSPGPPASDLRFPGAFGAGGLRTFGAVDSQVLMIFLVNGKWFSENHILSYIFIYFDIFDISSPANGPRARAWAQKKWHSPVHFC